MALKRFQEQRAKEKAEKEAARLPINKSEGDDVSWWDKEKGHTIYKTVRFAMLTDDGRPMVSFSDGTKKIFPKDFKFDQ